MEEIIKMHHGNLSGFSRHYLTLYSIVYGLEAKNVLELGCGFSSKVILEALKKTNGNLTTIDMRDIFDTGNSQSDIENNSNWNYVKGDTQKVLSKVVSNQFFDFVLHDGSHKWKEVFFDLIKIIPRVKKNGIILVHDTAHKSFKLWLAVKLSLLFTCHEKVTLPYGYGLTIIRILGNKKNGEVKFNWEKQKTIV